MLDLSLATVSKLLRALNECTEWGQVRAADGASNADLHVSPVVSLLAW